MTKDKPYKKRVIASSDDSDSDQQIPKKLKQEQLHSRSSDALFPEPIPAPRATIIKKEVNTVDALALPTKVKALLAAEHSDEDDEPIARKKVKTEKKEKKEKKLKENGSTTTHHAEGKKLPTQDNEDADSDTPMANIIEKIKPEATASPSKKSTKSKATISKEDDAGESSDVPMSQATKVVKAKAKEKGVKEKPPAKAKAVSEKKKPASKSPAKGKGKANGAVGERVDDDGDESDGVHRWWENEQGIAADHGPDGEIKWTTLEHAGVMFPPDYEPHGVKMLYDGKQVKLAPEAEEVASFFAALIEVNHGQNPVFQQNFFTSWLDVLQKHPTLNGIKIESFAKCDFTPIFEYLEAEKQKRKSISTVGKKAAKAAKDLEEEPYKTCLLDGRVEKVGNFRVEPPGLFRGRGAHPKTGLLKTRLAPEDITINVSEGAPVPAPPKGTNWKAVVHNDKVTWLATWHENINNAVKYVYLGAGSSFKGQSDFNKFEKARALKKHVDQIRLDYTSEFKAAEMVIRQRATAIYLIDKFALRNGNEKGEDAADTVGCCSLRFEHVTLTPPRKVTFDFLGKDSVRYVNSVEVDDQVFKNLKIFKKDPKVFGDLLFDRLNTGMVNKYLANCMPGLTAKVFRTYNASWTFVQQLADTPKDASLADKLLHYNRANRMVAVLCNHQKSVGKGHAANMEKINDKVLALKFQRKKYRATLYNTVGNAKKFPAHLEDESDLEDEWIKKHEVALVVLEREKITKKFERENKKHAEAVPPEPSLGDGVLVERLEAADVLAKNLKEDRAEKWKKSTSLSAEKISTAIVKLDERIIIAKHVALDKDEGKEISLGTSIQNYIDPRITYAWCKEHDVPISKILSKTLQEKFTWSAETDEDFDW